MTKSFVIAVSFFFLLSGTVFCQDHSARISQFEDPANIIAKETAMLNDLIEASQQNLKNLTYLKGLIQKYQTLQSQYMVNPDDNEALYQMIKTAHAILEKIKENHLAPLFDPAFLSELTIISKPAAKLGIPKP